MTSPRKFSPAEKLGTVITQIAEMVGEYGMDGFHHAPSLADLQAQLDELRQEITALESVSLTILPVRAPVLKADIERNWDGDVVCTPEEREEKDETLGEMMGFKE